MCNHEWIETKGGHTCQKCGEFIKTETLEKTSKRIDRCIDQWNQLPPSKSKDDIWYKIKSAILHYQEAKRETET